MSQLRELSCCIKSTDCVLSSPENRADCGNVIWTSGLFMQDNDLGEMAVGKQPAAEHVFRQPLPLRRPMGATKCIDPVTGVNQNGVGPTPCDCVSVCESRFRIHRQTGAFCFEEQDVNSYCSSLGGISVEDYILDHVQNEAWIRDYEQQALCIMNGLVADNIANHNGDMVIDIVNNPVLDSNGNETTAFNHAAHICARFNNGCNSNFAGIIMHEDVWKKLQVTEAHTNNCCEEVVYDGTMLRTPVLRNSMQGGNVIRTYAGMPVYLSIDPKLEEDGVYKTYYFGNGLFHFGSGDLTRKGIMPFEFDRDSCANGGMGKSTWLSRQAWVIHPMGWSNLWDGDGSADELIMSTAELENPVNWDRVMDRRNIQFVCVATEC